ncbi:MAG TPA: DUF5700 domain-containing putative Zn-dependent protease [Thermoanaerobaculia bacterium]|nr:DUF5700 domain-containing putative Zn-dependent protease [Thermoanaerobaculia bacterium]
MRPLRAAAGFLLLVACRHAAPDPRLQVPMVTDEADAVLAILEERSGGRSPAEPAWQRLFSSEGYRRLKEREASLQRGFDDASFREFVLSADLLERAPALSRTLAQWVRIDPAAAARRAFAYLPESAVIRARVYPAIKPKTNSFVFEPRTNPAIFLYLDPKVTPAKLENTLTHELHHIGVGSVCPDEPAGGVPENVKTALEWMSGFAEGRAVLAAAGGPDVHPHATSEPAERAVWERDFARVDDDVRRLESFFVAILDGKLVEDERNRQGMSFVSTADVPQGAYYTVGWLMSTVVERELGRRRLIESLCDPAMFLRDYDRSTRREMGARAVPLPAWSRSFLDRLPAKGPGRSD